MGKEIMMWSHASTVSPASDAHADLSELVSLKVSRSSKFASPFVR